MTQIKEGLIKSQAYTYAEMNSEYDATSEDKNESEMSQLRQSDKAEKIIKELKSMYGETKGKILELIETLKQDGLKDHEVKKVLFSRVDFISRPTLYRALPQEFKREYTKPLPKTINISSEHKVIDVESISDEEIKTQQTKMEVEITKELEEEDEDPTQTENQFLKERVAELEDALKKTEQFKPATQLEAKTLQPIIDDDGAFQYLRDRSKETGDIIVIDRVGSGALIPALAQYKHSFGAAELFLRVIKK